MIDMSKTLEKAIAEARNLPEDRQEQIGQWISDFVEQERSTMTLSAEQIAEVERRLANPNPVFATDEQMAAFFAKFAA